MNQPGKLSHVRQKESLQARLDSSSSSQDVVKFSINQLTTYRSSWEQDFQQAADSTISAVGLWTGKLADVNAQHVLECLAKLGLSVSSVSFAGGFTGSTGLSYREIMDEAYQTLFLAAGAEADCVVIAPGSRGNRYTAKHERRVVRHAVRELAFVADELGLKLAVLPMRAEFAGRWSYLHSLDDGLEFIEQVDHRCVGLAFDTFHLLDDLSTCELSPAVVERIALVQISDRGPEPQDAYDRCLPGEGCLPLMELISSMLQAGYGGYFDLQVWSNDVWKIPPADVIARCEEWIRFATSSCLPTAEQVFGR